MHFTMEMEPLLSPYAWFLALALIALISTFHFRRGGRTKKPPPHAAGGWPLIGHLPMMTGPNPLHVTLSAMADLYGPIFTVKLGSRRGLVVNTSEAAAECLKANDVAFSNRQRTAAMRLMGYDFAMFGFSNYGGYWREMRKISVSRLLSSRKVAALAASRRKHVRELMRAVEEGRRSDRRVDMKRVFGDLMLRLMVATVAGDVEAGMEEEGRERWRRSVRDFFKMMTVFTVADVIPWLKWVDRFGGWRRAFEKTGGEFDGMLQRWVEEHRRRRRDEEDDGDDFMTVMLGVSDAVAEEFPCYDADTITKATCLSMIVGGTETTAATLTWALALLLNNRQTLVKAQAELDLHVGRQRLVLESDLENLVFLRSVIKETMRLQPPIPVTPREAGEDCVVASYHIPAGTRLFVNNWKIQRDPRVWDEPSEFRPERFLTSHKEIDFQGLDFELLPFGAGRRVCPAISFAQRTAELALASFLHGFDVDTPSGGPVDMMAGFGSTNMRLTPLEVCLEPRLSPQLYA